MMQFDKCGKLVPYKESCGGLFYFINGNVQEVWDDVENIYGYSWVKKGLMKTTEHKQPSCVAPSLSVFLPEDVKCCHDVLL